MVKLVAIHDLQGNLFTLIAQPSDAPLCSNQLGPGQQASEIEMPDIRSELADADLGRLMKEMLESYIVVGAAKSGKLLVKKILLGVGMGLHWKGSNEPPFKVAACNSKS